VLSAGAGIRPGKNRRPPDGVDIPSSNNRRFPHRQELRRRLQGFDDPLGQLIDCEEGSEDCGFVSVHHLADQSGIRRDDQAGRARRFKHRPGHGPSASRHCSVAPLSPAEVILIPPSTCRCRFGQGNCKWLAGAAQFQRRAAPLRRERDRSPALYQSPYLLIPASGPAARWKPSWWWRSAVLGRLLEELPGLWAQIDSAQVDCRREGHEGPGSQLRGPAAPR
jgi:hypothetical protein